MGHLHYNNNMNNHYGEGNGPLYNYLQGQNSQYQMMYPNNHPDMNRGNGNNNGNNNGRRY